MIARTLPDRSHEWGPRRETGRTTCRDCDIPIVQSHSNVKVRCDECSMRHRRRGAWRRSKANRKFAYTPANPLYGRLLRSVANKYKVTIEDIQDCHQKPRAVAMARAELTLLFRANGLSYPDIAQLIGWTSHSSAIMAERVWRGRLAVG